MLGFPLFEFILLVLGFGFLIFVHELGHFAVAKWVGIRCPQFAIGFGKAMFSWRKGIGVMRGSTEAEYERRCVEKLKADGIEPEADGPHTGTARYDDVEVKEQHNRKYTGKQMFAVGDGLGLGATEYRLNYLPLGGYVKMLGQEDMDPNAKSDDPNAYNNKPIWARACVISAGVVMNMIFGAIFLAIAFSIGVEFPRATVGQVIPDMPATTTYAQGHEDDPSYLGFKEGDVILSVNGKEPEDFKDVKIAIALSGSGDDVTIVVKRRGIEEPLTYVCSLKRGKDAEKLLSVGLGPGPGLDIASFKEAEGAPAEWYRKRLELVPAEQRQKGQSIRIHAVNGQEVTNYPEYLAAFDASNGQPVQVTLWDDAEPNASSAFAVNALPTLTRTIGQPDNLLGMVPAGALSVVAEKSPAEEAGLKVGDVLVQVGSLEWPTQTMAIAEEVAKDKSAPLKVVVLRDGKQVDIGELKPNKDGKLGIVIGPAKRAVIGEVLEDLPAQALNKGDPFMPGTTITRINDTVITTWAEAQRVLKSLSTQEAQPTPITLTYRLPVASSLPEQVKLELSADDHLALAAAGWAPDHSSYFPVTDYTLLKATGLGDALMIGMDKTQDFVLQTYITLARLIQGDVKLYNLRGPVGIISTGTQVAQQGIPYLLFFLGLISVNLAVINFLPIPIVDGGHMVFLFWEKITGSPPSEKIQAWSLYAGLALIGFVFIATFYFDVMRELSKLF